MEKKRVFLRLPPPVPTEKPEEYLRERGAEADLTIMHEEDVPNVTLTDEMLSELKPHVIVVHRWMRLHPKYTITPEMMDACENLEMIQGWGSGYEDYPLDAATARGIYVCNNSAVPTAAESVCELAWAHIFALARRLPALNKKAKEGGWTKERKQIDTDIWGDTGRYRGGMILWGKTLGIIGLGNIGIRTAVIGKLGLNMRVLAYDPHINPIRAQLARVELVDLDTLLKESDVISLHATLKDETRHMIGARELNLMKETAYIINCARGHLIDFPALAKALEEKRIGGAGIDCWPDEPPQYDLDWVKSMMNSPRVIATIHCGTLYDGVLDRNKAILDNIARHCKGEVPSNVCNPEVLYKLRKK